MRLLSVSVVVLILLVPVPGRAQSVKSGDMVGVWLEGMGDSLIVQADSIFIWTRGGGDASSRRRFPSRWKLLARDTITFVPYKTVTGKADSAAFAITLTEKNQVLTLGPVVNANSWGSGTYKRVDDITIPASAPPLKPADLVGTWVWVNDTITIGHDTDNTVMFRWSANGMKESARWPLNGDILTNPAASPSHKGWKVMVIPTKDQQSVLLFTDVASGRRVGNYKRINTP